METGMDEIAVEKSITNNLHQHRKLYQWGD